MAGSKLSPFVLRPELHNLLIDLELSDTQRILALTMYSLAEPNGVLEKNPSGLIRQANTGKLGDVSLVYDILENAGIIEFFYVNQANYDNKRNVFQYIYLSNYLDDQWHNTKSRLPSPPWVMFEPHTMKSGDKDWSKGHYIDTRKQNLFLSPIEESSKLDTNPQAEVNGMEENRKEGKEPAKAPKDKNKTTDIDNTKTPYERMELALKEVLDGRYKLRSTLHDDPKIQKEQIMACLKINSNNLGITDILNEFDIEPDGNDWKPYQRPKTPQNIPPNK